MGTTTTTQQTGTHNNNPLFQNLLDNNQQRTSTMIQTPYNDDAFRQAIDINKETSFVEAATGRYNDQIGTKIETQINELEDSFQEYVINAMNTRSTNRSGCILKRIFRQIIKQK